MTSWGFNLKNIQAEWEKDKPILSDINIKFDVPDKGVAALPLMGPSGEGKSTLMYLLASLKWQKIGHINWTFPDGKKRSWNGDGKNIGNKQAAKLRRSHFGFSFQTSSLHPSLSVQENLAYPLSMLGTKWKMALKEAEKKVDDFLLPTEKSVKQKNSLMNRYPHQLSGGQKQRIALAQAIIHDPYVLFADEPTGQLDYHTRKQVMQKLRHWV